MSGRKALFVNRSFTTRIVQLARHESDAVLALLLAHLERPEFQCRLQWRPGSVAFRDGRCAQRHAIWDDYPNRRRGAPFPGVFKHLRSTGGRCATNRTRDSAA